jgi:origin recognition complex subunit 6
MPSPIEIALSSLLPTVSYLPPELISLSTSLLAQSRTKASSLKAEEEIGRTYACCHIACQRLGHKLALEIGKPAPPVKPKVYNKLHTYLNAALKTTSTSRPANGGKTNEQPQEGTAGKSTRGATTAQTTPSKPTPVSTTTPTSRKRPAPSASQDADADPANIPDALKPTIRLICASSFDPGAIPHVFAGLSSILTHLRTPHTPKRGTKRPRIEKTGEFVPTTIHDDQLTNLAIAVFVVVYSRTRGEWNVDEFDVVDRAGRALRRHDTGDPEAEFVYNEEKAMTKEVQHFKKSIREAWWEMEWIRNVPVPPETLEDVMKMSEEELENLQMERGIPGAKRAGKTPVRNAKTPLREKRVRVDGDGVGAAGLMPGLGTMFQPAVDWLSEERQVEFERWKRQVLRDAGVVS